MDECARLGLDRPYTMESGIADERKSHAAGMLLNFKRRRRSPLEIEREIERMQRGDW